MGMQNLDEGAHMPLYWFRNSQTREFVPLEDVENILDVHFTQADYVVENPARSEGQKLNLPAPKGKNIETKYKLSNCNSELKEHDINVFRWLKNKKITVYCPKDSETKLILGGKRYGTH